MGGPRVVHGFSMASPCWRPEESGPALACLGAFRAADTQSRAAVHELQGLWFRGAAQSESGN